MDNYKVVYIVWTDAAVIGEWQTLKELDNQAIPCVTVGFLLPKKSRDYYYIANTVAPNINIDEVIANGVIMIPKKWIKEFKEITI